MARYRTCDGITRRDALKIGSLGLMGLTLPDLLRMEAVAAAEKPGKAKAAILLWLGGGPSHVETFDPKPDSPRETRGEFGAISVKGGDFQICEHMPRLAQMGEKFSVLRSVTHPEGAHERGTTYMLTGYRAIPGFEYPGFGSVVAKEKGWQITCRPMSRCRAWSAKPERATWARRAVRSPPATRARATTRCETSSFRTR